MKRLTTRLFLCSVFSLFNLYAQYPDIDFAFGINSTHPGGGASKQVVLDQSGNTYIAGGIQGTSDVDPSIATANLTSAGDVDGFVGKYDMDGNYVWAFRFGGPDYEVVQRIAVDTGGFVYITGFIEGTADMDPGASVANVTSAAGGTFLAKYDSLGNYVWSFIISGPSPTTVTDMFLDVNNRIYLTGAYANTVDFDPSGGVANLTMGSGSTYDIYLAKYDLNGNYMWARGLDAQSAGVSNAITADASGNVYLGGVFNGTVDFDPGVATVNLTCASPGNMFLAKYNASGNYTWAIQMGDPTNNEAIMDLAVDGIGNVVCTGSFVGPNATDFNPGAGTDSHIPYSSSYNDGFVAKYSPAGVHIFANAFGGATNDFGLAIATDPARNVYVTGYYSDTVDFDPSVATYSLISNGINPDMFIVKYNLTGNFVWAASVGGAGVESSQSIAVEHNGKLWITGTFSSAAADFDPTAATYNLSAPGAGTIFLAKYEYCMPINLSEVSHDNVTCFNGNDGSIQIHTEGNSPFAYSWSPSGGTDSIASNLAAGLYTCTVTSACGGTNSISTLITQSAMIDPEVVSQTNVFCYGDSTGIAEVSAIGGVGTLDFNWLPGGMNTALVTDLYATTYTCTVTDDNGCTSTQTITITQSPLIGFSQSPQLCSGDSIIVGTNVYNSTGTYIDTYVAFNGCDSVVTTNLTIHPPINVNVNLSGITLTSIATPANYQWVDCNNTMLPILGATAQTYIPVINGNYAVVVNQNGCIDTSLCYEINSVGIENIVQNPTVYPNPFIDQFLVDVLFDDLTDILITDMGGKNISYVKTNSLGKSVFYLKATPGVYILHYRNGQSYGRIKLLKVE